MSVSVMLSQAALADIHTALPRIDPDQFKEMVRHYLSSHDPLSAGKPSSRGSGSVVVLCIRAHCYVLLEIVDKAKKKFQVHAVAKREAQINKLARKRKI